MPEALRYSSAYDGLMRQAGADCGVDWLLLKAQAIVESNLNPNKIGPFRAMGLAQMTPSAWHAWSGCASARTSRSAAPKLDPDPFNPADAIASQARRMRWFIDYFHGDVHLALLACGWGLGMLRWHMRQFGGLDERQVPLDARDYVARIECLYAEFGSPSHETSRPKGGSMPDGIQQVESVKHVFESRTVWVNAVASIVTIGLSLIGVPVPDGAVLATIASAIINVALRLVTKQPVAFTL